MDLDLAAIHISHMGTDRIEEVTVVRHHYDDVS